MLKDCKDSFSSGKQLGMILTSTFNLVNCLQSLFDIQQSKKVGMFLALT